MTEKRFTFADGFNIVAIRDNGEIMNSNQVCEKLNELHEQNEVCREAYKELKQEVIKLNKENKGLKKELDSFNPVVFNDMIKGTVILYNKGDVE